jgi:enamine deaminase RidA (YjgF/YER057c/UK114 family)
MRARSRSRPPKRSNALLSVTIYLKDVALFDRMNAVWQNWVDPEHLPARCTVQATLGLPELLVEFSVTAAA